MNDRKPSVFSPTEEIISPANRQEYLSQLMEHTCHYIHNYSGRGGQGRVLRTLYRHSPMSQRDLQEHLQIQSGTLSETLTKLENAGFITRQRDEDDHRRCILFITDAGKTDFEEHETRRLHRQSALYQALTEQEQEELIRILQKLQKDWAENTEAEK